MATATGQRELLRFNDVQVYFHGLIALSILVLWVTGLPLTFNQALGWIIDVIGNTNIVLVHVIAGGALVAGSVFYLVYGVLGFVAGENTVRNVLPGLEDAREGFQHLLYLAGVREAPESGKYSFLQKAEIWIIAFEVIAMAVSGVVLWAGKLNGASPAPLLLIIRDVHAIVAVTMLVGVTFHLFMTHVKEYPLDRSMFQGTVSIGRACEEWQSWARQVTGRSEAPCEESTHSTILTTGAILGMVVFAVVWTGVILQYVLSPIPTGGLRVTTALSPNAMPGGLLGGVYAVGLNLAVLVILGAIVALGYGFVDRWTVG